MSTNGSAPQHRPKRTPEERQAYIDELAIRSEELYFAWGGGVLRDTIKKINHHLETNAGSVHDTEVIRNNIEAARNRAIDEFVARKRERRPEFKHSDVRGLYILVEKFEPREDLKNWLWNAKSAAYEVEQFMSHTLRKNPHPRSKKGKEPPYDPSREERSSQEQAWLVAEDKYCKVTSSKRKSKGKKGKKGKKDKARAEEVPEYLPGGEEVLPVDPAKESRYWAGQARMSRALATSRRALGIPKAPAQPRPPVTQQARAQPRPPVTQQARAQPRPRPSARVGLPRFPDFPDF